MSNRHIILGRESKYGGVPAYSSAVVAGDTIYLAGHGPGRDGQGNIVGRGDVEAQAVATFEALKTTLEAAGATFADLVKITVYTTKAEYRPKVREVRSRYIPQPPPASASIIISGLADPDMMLEVEGIAVANRKR